MPQLTWLSIAVLLFAACEPTAALDVGASTPALRRGDDYGKRSHVRKRRHHRLECRETTPQGAASCGFQDYIDGLSGAPANFAWFDPRAPGVAYAHAGGIVWRSTDGAASWSPLAEANNVLIDLEPDGADPNDLIAATLSGVQVSTNAGASWRPLALQGVVVDALEISPSEPQRLYATLELGPLLVSRDRGGRWEAASTNYPRGKTFQLSVDPRDAQNLLATLLFYVPNTRTPADAGAIYRTTDGGVTWLPVYEPGVSVLSLQRCAANPDVLIAGTPFGVARSVDNGATWTSIPIPPNPSGIHALAINPQDCDDFYALQANAGPLHTRDAGQTFQLPLMEGLQVMRTGGFPGTMSIDPADPAHLILATHNGFYTSRDSGDHWTLLPAMMHMNVAALGVSSSAPSRAWLVTWGQGVWTRDGASSPWQRVGLERLARDYAASISFDDQHGRVFIGANNALLSRDGQTFQELATRGLAFDAAFDPTDPALIYVATQVFGLYKSEDGGQTWRTSNGAIQPWGPAPGSIDVRAVELNPDNPQQVFIATNANGIHRSDDRGQTWTQVLASPHYGGCLLAVPDAPLRLYACLNGVVSSSDAGDTWTTLNDGLDSLWVGQLAHDAATGHLYASTSSGVYVLRQGESRWELLDESCPTPGATLAIMEEAGQRYLLVGAEHAVKRFAL